MKNLFSVSLIRLLGIIALAAVISFGFIACGEEDDDPPPPSLQGKWKLEVDSEYYDYWLLEFSGSNYTLKVCLTEGGLINSTRGTFTSTATTFTLNLTHIWNNGNEEWIDFDELDPLVVPYVLTETTLTVSGLTGSDAPYNGVWKRQ